MVAERASASGEPVASAAVRDARVAREISTAPVVRAPLPIVPTETSIRVSREATSSATRPPAELFSRAVVTRRPPPPAPVRFRDKERLIRENRGAPLVPAEASRLATEGRVELAPRDARGADPAPVPVTREAPPRRSRSEIPATAGREQPSTPPARAASPHGDLPPAPHGAARRAEPARAQRQAAEAIRPARPEARDADERKKAAEKAKAAKDRKKVKPPRSVDRWGVAGRWERVPEGRRR